MSKAILLLHGFATDSNDFKNIIKELKKRYEIVRAPTLPSHKKKNHLKDFSVQEVFSCFEKEYDELVEKYEAIDIMGFSMGGAVAAYLASKGNVDNLILLAPANAYLNAILPISRIKMFFEYLFSAISVPSEEISLFQKDTFLNSLEDDKISLDVAFKKLLPNYRYHSINAFRDVIKKCNKGLKKIAAHTLIVYGTVDQLVPKHSIRMVAKHCDDCKTIILPGISHLMLNSRNYEIVCDCVLQFIDDVEENELAI